MMTCLVVFSGRIQTNALLQPECVPLWTEALSNLEEGAQYLYLEPHTVLMYLQEIYQRDS